MVVFVDLKKKKRKKKKTQFFLCFTDTLSATLLYFFLLSKSNYTLLIKNSILTGAQQHPLTKAKSKMCGGGKCEKTIHNV